MLASAVHSVPFTLNRHRSQSELFSWWRSSHASFPKDQTFVVCLLCCCGSALAFTTTGFDNTECLEEGLGLQTWSFSVSRVRAAAQFTLSNWEQLPQQKQWSLPRYFRSIWSCPWPVEVSSSNSSVPLRQPLAEAFLLGGLKPLTQQQSRVSGMGNKIWEIVMNCVVMEKALWLLPFDPRILAVEERLPCISLWSQEQPASYSLVL